MAASDTELVFELTNSVFVQSVESPNAVSGPVFYADDIRPILLKLVRRTTPTTVEVVDLTGVTVQVAIGTPAASPTVITSATAGVVDSNGFLPISLPLNVAAVQTALGTALQITPTFEIRVVFSTPQRFQTSCTLKQRVITGTLADPEPPAVAVSLEEVLALCVPRDGSVDGQKCASFIMVDENDDSISYRVSARDGQFHFETL